VDKEHASAAAGEIDKLGSHLGTPEKSKCHLERQKDWGVNQNNAYFNRQQVMAFMTSLSNVASTAPTLKLDCYASRGGYSSRHMDSIRVMMVVRWDMKGSGHR
jgi:hypothetical protein